MYQVLDQSMELLVNQKLYQNKQSQIVSLNDQEHCERSRYDSWKFEAASLQRNHLIQALILTVPRYRKDRVPSRNLSRNCSTYQSTGRKEKKSTGILLAKIFLDHHYFVSSPEITKTGLFGSVISTTSSLFIWQLHAQETQTNIKMESKQSSTGCSNERTQKMH